MNKQVFFYGSIYKGFKDALPETFKARVRRACEERDLPLGMLKYRIKSILQRKDWRAIWHLFSTNSSASPRISIVVPVYNHSRYLRTCLNSLALQTYRNLDVIVIDDGSTESGTTEILSEFLDKPMFRVAFNNGNAGISPTLNRGIQMATGDFVAFVDCDDLLYPYSIAECVREIERHSDADYFFTDRVHIDPSGQEIIKVTFGNRPDLIGKPFEQALLQAMFASHLKIVRRSAFQKAGLFDPGIDGCQDYDLALRFSETCKMHYIPLPLYLHRWHPESVTLRSNQKQQMVSAQVIQKAIRRRYLRSWTPDPDWQPDSKLSLLFIVPNLVIGGAEQVLYQLISEITLSPEVRAVHVFCEFEKGAWWDRFNDIPGICLHFIGGSSHAPEAKLDYLQLLVKRERINTVHISNSELGYRFAERIRDLHPRPFVIDTVHSDQSGFIGFSAPYRFYLDSRVVVCRAAKSNLHASTGEDSRRIHLIYNGTTPLEASLDRSKILDRWKIPGEAKVVAFVGRLSSEKCPLALPGIARLVLEHVPQAVFLVAGDGPQRKPLEADIREMGLEAAFRVIGASDLVGDVLEVSDALLIPSETEGHPLVLIEAMLAGLSTVASNVGGITEVLRHGKTGFLVTPGDTLGFARSLVSLLTAPEKAEEFGRHAEKLAASRFSRSRMGASYLALYRRGLRRGLVDGGHKTVSIVILSFNRHNSLKRCIESLDKHTRLPYELIVLDNGSSQEDTLAYCHELAKRPNVTVLFEEKNHGCSLGRKKALQHAKGDYLVTLDNDIEVDAGWLEALILRVEADDRIAGACCKVVNPDGRIEFNGGGWKLVGKTVSFTLLHNGLKEDALEAQEHIDCAWIPGGATLVKRGAAELVEHSDEFPNAFEDNDYSLQLGRLGYRLVNCPESRVVHHHRSFMGEVERAQESEYLETREKKKTIKASLLAFYRRNRLAIYDPGLFSFLGMPEIENREDLLAFYEASLEVVVQERV